MPRISISVDRNTDPDDARDALEQALAFFASIGEAATPPHVIPPNAPANALPGPQGSGPVVPGVAAASAQQQQQQHGGAETDSEGLRWDDRIHSTPATKTGKGVWRARRGADPQLVAQIRAEQQGTQQGGAPNSMPPSPPQQPSAPAFAAPPQQQPAAPNHYADLIGIIGRHTFDANTNPTGRINAEWTASYLHNLNVPGGLLENVATLPAEQQAYIAGEFRRTLEPA